MIAGRDAQQRLREFETVTDTALAHLNTEDLLHELLDRVRDLLEVDTAVVLSHEESPRQLVAEAAVGVRHGIHHGIRIPISEPFVRQLIKHGKPHVLTTEERDSLAALLWEKRLRIVVEAPLLVGGRLIGVLQVGSRVERRFTEHETHLLQVVADRIALAMQARVTSAERAAVTTLQRSLLPPLPPTVPGLAFAARYVPGAGTSVGGDWYDVFELPGKRVGIVIGDVAGHGLAAAVIMGRLRSALRAYALETEDPATVLEKLDRKAIYFEADVMTTVLYAVVELPEERLRLSLAGHLPPILAEPGSQARFVDAPVDPPIGVLQPNGARRGGTVEVPAGGVFCFYTDGLVERRDRTLDDGLEALRRAVHVGPPEKLCAELMSTMLDTETWEDDIAVLLMRRHRVPDEPAH